MNPQLVIAVAAGAVILAAFAGLVGWAMLNAHQAEKAFATRILAAIGEPAAVAPVREEGVSLTRTVTQVDLFKARAAGFIGVDLSQAETYPIKWWLVPPIAFVAAFVIVTLASHPLGHKYLLLVAGLPLLTWGITKLAFGWFRNRRNAKLLEQFPDALGTVVRCVRVGIPVGESLRIVTRDAPEPTRAEFAILADKVAIGIPLDVALREISGRIKMTEYQFFATAITLQARSGGGISQTLETLAEVIRKRVGLKARGYALTAEARMSSMILAVLPFVAGGAIFVMQRPYIALLFSTKSGQSCLGLAVLLMGMGLGTIQYMISSVLK